MTLPRTASAVREALGLLGIDAFVLAVHDASYPSAPGEDVGRGSPYGSGADQLHALAAALGFDVARSELSIDLEALVRDGWLDRATVARIVANRPDGDRASHAHVVDAQRAALGEAWSTFRTRLGAADDLGARALDAELTAFRAANAAWLERDGAFEALATQHGTEDRRVRPPRRVRRFARGPAAPSAAGFA